MGHRCVKLKVTLACLGRMASAIQTNGFWSWQKAFYKLFFTIRDKCTKMFSVGQINKVRGRFHAMQVRASRNKPSTSFICLTRDGKRVPHV